MLKYSIKKIGARIGSSNFVLLSVLYTCILILLSIIACFFSYQQRQKELLSDIDLIYLQLKQEYSSVIDNFWQIYMPIFESGSSNTVSETLEHYFSADNSQQLTPLEQNTLKEILTTMMLRDNKIQWIALYSPERDSNYVVHNSGSSMTQLPSDFPYLEKLREPSSQMSVLGRETLIFSNMYYHTYALAGGIPKYMGDGKIIVGYSTSGMEQAVSENFPLKSLRFQLTANGETLFCSDGKYDDPEIFPEMASLNGIRKAADGRRLFVRSEPIAHRSSLLSYSMSWWELFFYSHAFTPLILLIVLCFAGFSIIIYSLMMHMINREVNSIREGLSTMAQNRLDYRLPTRYRQSGLPEIARAINDMAEELNDNINRAYYYELKQKESELSELQSKFNPHFLYNTLEMFRSRCYQNGDEETAELMSQLSSIFRGFIGSRTFIPLSEELSFGRRYLSLFEARYQGRVKIRYNIDTDLLKYGIIRNVFQPLIENYFVHGFDSSKEDSYILFRGTSLDEHHMVIIVEDNGLGMDPESMKQLNNKFQEKVRIDTESYGLKNLHQRLRLFYGEDCGLSIEPNGEKGLRIKMVLLKMTCEQYETEKQVK